MVARRRVDGFDPDPNFSESTDEDRDESSIAYASQMTKPVSTDIQSEVSINPAERDSPDIRYSQKTSLLGNQEH